MRAYTWNIYIYMYVYGASLGSCVCEWGDDQQSILLWHIIYATFNNAYSNCIILYSIIYLVRFNTVNCARHTSSNLWVFERRRKNDENRFCNHISLWPRCWDKRIILSLTWCLRTAKRVSHHICNFFFS